jgi:hypothetical protein
MHHDPKQAFPFSVISGATTHWSKDANARQVALDFGKLHMDGMASLAKLGESHGGGLAGIIVGVIEAYLEAGLITASDRERLIDLFEAFRELDRSKAGSRIVAIHAAAVADAESSPAALAVSSVAVSSIQAPVTFGGSWKAGFLTGYADAAGTLVGTAGGPIGAASTGIMASTLADHATS